MGNLVIKKNEDGTFSINETTVQMWPEPQVRALGKHLRMQQTILTNRLAWPDEKIVAAEKALHPKFQGELKELAEAIATIDAILPPEKEHGKVGGKVEPGASS